MLKFLQRTFGSEERDPAEIEKLKENVRGYLERNLIVLKKRLVKDKRVATETDRDKSDSEESFSLCGDTSFSLEIPGKEWWRKGFLEEELRRISLKPTFSQILFRKINEKGISESKCYKRSNLDRRLFSKIRSERDYHPQKNTVFALIIGLKLDMDEANELLEAAGYSFSCCIKMDVIMEYLIKEKVYDILTVNEILYSFDCPLLGSK